MSTAVASIEEALALCRAGQLDAARACLDAHVAEHPDALIAHLLRARIHVDQGQWPGALAAARVALSLHGTEAGAWYALGRAHQGLGDSATAVNCHRRALAAEPCNPQILTHLARTLHSLGRRDQAIRNYQAALAADPRHGEARTHLDRIIGLLPGGRARLEQLRSEAGRLQAAGQLREAFELHREALRIAPQLAGLWLSTGLLAHALGDRYASLQGFEQAARLAPTSFPAIEAARRVCTSAGMLAEAERYSALAYRLQPSDDIRIAQALTIAAIQPSVAAITSGRQAYEQRLDAALAAHFKVTSLDAAQGMNGFFLAYHGADDRALQVKAARLLAEAAPWLTMTAPHCSAPRRAGKIRVGIISSFLYDHSIGNTTRGLVTHLSRDRFEVSVLRIMPSPNDGVTASIRRDADHMLDLDPTLRHARDQIAALELDILFYQDIGMEPKSYALGFARLAPVQCVSFGHPNTTGIPAIDYFVSNDLYEARDAATHYSERLFLLHDLPTLAYYYRPLQPAAAAADRETFALRATDHVYLCPQTLYKIHPEFDALIGEILQRDPQGVAVFIRSPYYDYTERLQERFAQTLSGVTERIVFLDSMPYPRFMQLLSIADVCLDTLHFNGMNTSLEALSMGTPIVTLPGEFQRGRHTQAMYRKMDMSECIAADVGDYVDIALRLGCDKDYAAAVRSRILARNSVLYEDRRVIEEFERFFITAFEDARPEVSWPTP